jgi:hypothetical protein
VIFPSLNLYLFSLEPTRICRIVQDEW